MSQPKVMARLSIHYGEGSGGDYSGDGVNIETRWAYVDFLVPGTLDQRVTLGLINQFRHLWQNFCQVCPRRQVVERIVGKLLMASNHLGFRPLPDLSRFLQTCCKSHLGKFD